MGTPTNIPPAWSKDGQRLYFQVVRHGSTLLMSVDRDGNDLKTIVGPPGVVTQFSLDGSRTKIAYFRGEMADPGQIWVMDLENGESRVLTSVNRDLLDSLDLGEMEEVWFKGAAGNDLQGWILKPPGFDPMKKYPSILEIHGGPLTQYGFFFMHEFYFLAASDFVVSFCNPRGGQGYGEAHSGAIHNPAGRWATVDYDDLMAWADHHFPKTLYRSRAHGGDGRQLWRLYDQLDHRPYRPVQGGCHRAERQQPGQHVGIQRFQLELPGDL